MTTKSYQRQRGEAESADRYRAAWEMRQAGMRYPEIGERLGISANRARQIAVRAERRLKLACEAYSHPIDDPLIYGVWHEFTVKGRIGLRDERGM